MFTLIFAPAILLAALQNGVTEMKNGPAATHVGPGGGCDPGTTEGTVENKGQVSSGHVSPSTHIIVQGGIQPNGNRSSKSNRIIVHGGAPKAGETGNGIIVQGGRQPSASKKEDAPAANAQPN